MSRGDYMQTVPDAYIEAMHADSRSIYWQVTFCDKDTWSGWMLDDNDFESCDVVQELQDVGVPCAYIGQNIATIKVYNADGMFTTARTETVDKYIKRGTRVVIHNNVPMKASTASSVVFTGYVDTVEMDAENQFCTITAYDSLHFLKKQKAPWFRPTGYYKEMQMKLKDFIAYFLQLCGCVESGPENTEIPGVCFNIDPNLLYEPVFTYIDGDTIGDVLESFAKAGLCAIFCNAFDVICVRMLPKTRNVVYTFNDMTQVVSSSTAQLGYSDYTHVSVVVHDTLGSSNVRNKVHSSYSVEDKGILLGDNALNNISLSSSRVPAAVRIITNERITEGASSEYDVAAVGFIQYIKGYDYCLNKINLNVYSTKGMVVDFNVYSYYLWETTNSEVEAASPEYTEDSFFLIKNVLEIDVPLITDSSYAGQIANTFSKMLLDTKDLISCTVRGEPAIGLLDLVVIDNPRAAHDSIQVMPTRLQYTYDGSLSCEMEAIKYSAVSMVVYAFLMPGMYIPYDTGATYIQAKARPEDAGLVEGAGAYAVGDKAILSCTPFTGYRVAYWAAYSGSGITKVGAGNSIVIYVDPAVTMYVAVMEEDEAFTTFTLDINSVDEANVILPPMSLSAVSGAIDWGDGTVEDYDATDEAEHTYEMTGTFPITLRAPIENFSYEIFANNSQINTFTAGSRMLYLPNGMFYNSSVKNVNLMPAKNIICDKGGAQIIKNINTYFVNVGTPSISTDQDNYSSIAIAMNNTGISQFNIPKYRVGVPVTAVEASRTGDNIHFPNNTGFTQILIYGGSYVQPRNISNIAYANHMYAYGLNFINTLSIPNDIKIFYIDALPNIVTLNIPPTLGELVFAYQTVPNKLTDIYVSNGSTSLFINCTGNIGPTQTVNVHIPDTLTDLTMSNSANFKVVPY